MKRAVIATILLFAAESFAWEAVCPPGTGIVRNTTTGGGECQPGGLGDIAPLIPTIVPLIPTAVPQIIPTQVPTPFVPTPVPTLPAPTPQPTFVYTAPTPQPTQALDPTGSTASYNFAATSSNACINGPSTITVTGAVDGDACLVGVPAAAIGTGVFYVCHVSAANTVTLRACKIGTTAFDPSPGTFTVRIVRP